MREIKLRTWHPELKYMIYCDPLHLIWDSPAGGYRIVSNQLENVVYHCFNGTPSVMECTGARDKNGKEVYEYDIIRCKRFYIPPCREVSPGVFHSSGSDIKELGEEIGIVFFDTLGLKWTVEFRRYDDFDDLSHYCAPHRIEVVGNTFENSDLLKGFRNSEWSSL